MKRFLLGLSLLTGGGCMNMQPVGPMAKAMKSSPAPQAVASDPEAATPDAVSVAATRPVPPAILIVPEEVTPENASSATRKLMDEYEYDRKTIPPNTTGEISVIKGGVRQ